LLVKNWYDRADELVSIYIYEQQSVNLTCPSYSIPTVFKLQIDSGPEVLSEVLSNKSGTVYTHSTLLTIVFPLSHHSGVYFCYGSHQNGTHLNRTFVLYVGCKLSNYSIISSIQIYLRKYKVIA